jgi:hypothetical protein
MAGAEESAEEAVATEAGAGAEEAAVEEATSTTGARAVENDGRMDPEEAGAVVLLLSVAVGLGSTPLL